MKKTLLILIFVLCLFPAFSQISFSGIDLNTKNELLFNVSHKARTESNYKSLFLYDLDQKVTLSSSVMKKANPKLITTYPQSIEMLNDNSVLQIRNRYGNAYLSLKDKSIKWVDISDEVKANPGSYIPVLSNRLDALEISPNGKWICFIQKKTNSLGTLILKKTDGSVSYKLADNIEYSFEKFPVSWSPNSSILIYQKNNNLYFLNLKNESSLKQIPENYRIIGPGNINCIYWASEKALMYINEEIVYSIPANELYTRALYSDLVGTGKIVGRLPYNFNRDSDTFWTSSDGLEIVMVQNNRTLWYMELSGMDFNWVSTLFSYPFVNIPGTALTFKVFWTQKTLTENEIPVIWIELLRSGKTESYVYRLQKNTEQNNAYFTHLPMSVNVNNPKLSPDKSKLSFSNDTSIFVYDINKWEQKYYLDDINLVSYCWYDSKNIFLGLENTIEKWNFLSDDKPEVFAISQSENYGWSNVHNTVLVKNDRGLFEYNESLNNFYPSDDELLRSHEVQNTKYRVFIGKSVNADYENTLYARKLTSVSSNIPLFNTAKAMNKYTKARVALAIDCLDSSDGITAILNCLAKYNLKATFFFNGEFVRRFPNAVQEILNQDHTAASMFYTTFSLDTRDFKIDEEFIRKGLARNEDDFFESSGGELNLIWHAPYYFSNQTLKNASLLSGYKFIDEVLDVKDTVTIEKALMGLEQYIPTSELIETIVQNAQNGSIIPISSGISEGKRIDYLYDKLDLVLSGLLKRNFEIVTINELE